MLIILKIFDHEKDEDCRKQTCVNLGSFYGNLPNCKPLPPNSICNPTDACATFICANGQYLVLYNFWISKV